MDKRLQTQKTSKIRKLPWVSALSRLDGAYADSTLRAYRADIRSFITWCEKENRRPFPANPTVISAFIAHEAERCSASTIKRRLAALGKIHRLLKLKDHVDDEDVKLALRRALRNKSARPNQALGLTRTLRDKLINACDNTLIGKRDKALISIGYDTLARRSELVAMNVEDIISSDFSAKILIRRSKNDQFGSGRLANISKNTMVLARAWLEASKIDSGPVFRSVIHNRIQGCPLHPNSINRIIKKSAKRAAFPQHTIAKLTGHSMRVGAAQDMMTAGLDILPIMAAGGWKTTNVVARYVENADISPLLEDFFK